MLLAAAVAEFQAQRAPPVAGQIISEALEESRKYFALRANDHELK